MSAGEESHEERAARNQALFRAVNERVETINVAFEFAEPMGDWICECEDVSCTTQIRMTIAEYEAVRANPRRFAVLPGHVLPDVERVVETSDGFVVVEKVGAAGEIAEELDPRAG